MFEAQSRGQPKLVYARASSNDASQDQEGDMSSYVRNLVARIAKEEINHQQPLKHKQLSETGIQGESLQANQRGYETNASGDKDNCLQRGQIYQLKPTDFRHSVEKKRPSESNVSVKQYISTVTQREADNLTESNKRHLQPSYVLNDKLKSSQIEMVQLRASEGGALNSIEKSPVGPKLNNALSLPTSAADGRLKSIGLHSTVNRAETGSLMSTAVGKARTAESQSVTAHMEKVATVVASIERVYSSSTPSTITTDKGVMILSKSRSTDNVAPIVSMINTERAASISQTPTATAGKIETASSLSKVTGRGGTFETASSLSKASTLEKCSPISPTFSAASAGRLETVSSLLKTTAVDKMTPVSPNSTAAARGKLETTTPLLKDASLERSIPLSPTSTATAEKPGPASQLPQATSVDKIGKSSAVDSDNVSNVSNFIIDRILSSSFTQSALIPKHIYSSSPIPTSKENAQQNNSVLQPEQPTVLHSQRQVIETPSQHTQDTKLHATTIQIHSFAQQRQQTPISLSPKSDHSMITCNTAPISNRFQSLEKPSSARISETPPIEDDQDSEPTLTSPDSCLSFASSSPPKSILKSTTSFDKGETLIISGNHNEESADYCDFGSQKSFKNESFSVKKQVQSFFKTKISSSPPQLKRQITVDFTTTIPEVNKEDRVSKKSVTFNSEVRLHMENDESTIDTLPLDE